MSKTIGFVLNAPINYSETFLLQEFRLLEKAGYKILIFEGYGPKCIPYNFKTIQALPVSIKSFHEFRHAWKTLIRLLFSGLFSLIRFIQLELGSGTGFVRALKRVYFNAHILSQKPDYLHFCFADIAIQKEFTARAIKAKMSVSLRGSDILIYPLKNKNCYNMLWENTDKVHVVSKHLLDKSRELGLSPIIKTQLIPDGIETINITFNSKDLQKPLRVLSIGRLEPVKDFKLALQAIKYLIDSKTDLHYTLIGEGSEKATLINQVKELEIERYVTFRGMLKHDSILEEITSYDLFLHTSKSEGLGVALLEAQAAGLLTIALDAGGTEESIEDGKSGWIIRERKPSVIANKILEILHIPIKEKMKVKLYARKRIEEKFDIQNLLPKWKEFFD